MLSDKTLAYGKQATTGLLGVDALYRAENDDEDGLVVINICQKTRQEVAAFEVEVHMKRADEHPKVFTEAEIEYFVTGKGVQEKAVVRAIELSAARYCPAHAMLGKIMPIAIKYHIYEDMGDEKPEMVVSGTLDMALEA